MRKLSALCLTVLLFAACSKNTSIETGSGNSTGNGNNSGTGGNNNGGSGGNSNSTYYIKFSLDGTAKNFDANTQALMTSAFSATILSFVASSSANNGLENINLTINNTPSSNPIGAGTYTEGDILNFFVTGIYSPGTSLTASYAAGFAPKPTNPLKIVISSIDDKTASGTFSGDFLFANSTTQTFGPDKKVITNGQFYLPIKKQ